MIIRHTRICENVQQSPNAGVTTSNGICYRHSENFFEFIFVNFNAVPFRFVHHIKIDNKRNTLFHKLNGKEKITRHI